MTKAKEALDNIQHPSDLRALSNTELTELVGHLAKNSKPAVIVNYDNQHMEQWD